MDYWVGYGLGAGGVSLSFSSNMNGIVVVSVYDELKAHVEFWFAHDDVRLQRRETQLVSDIREVFGESDNNLI